MGLVNTSELSRYNLVMTDIEARKAQHIQLAMKNESQGNDDPFANIQLPIKTLPELDLKNVDISTEILGKKINQPLIIASMTGGAAFAEKININLATAAEETKVAMGVGSQRAALEKPEVENTFELVRKYAPKTVIMANMGAVQLNYGRVVEDYKRIVEMVEADGLYLHINAMQEALQPEGDTNWEGIEKKIEKLVKMINVPVLIKEVGGGIDTGTARKLVEMGIYGIDVAGVGGTSWTWIEGKRSGNKNLTEWFANFGITTDESVRICASTRKGFNSEVKIVASGGMRNPIQGLKAHLLGADYYSAARPFLEVAMKSEAATVNLIRDWEKGLGLAMFGCGMKNWELSQ